MGHFTADGTDGTNGKNSFRFLIRDFRAIRGWILFLLLLSLPGRRGENLLWNEA